MAKSPQNAPAADPPESFEAALSELESIVQGMEGGRLSLEQSLAAYQRGATLLRYCQQTLAAAEQQVEVLEAGVMREFSRGPDSDVQ